MKNKRRFFRALGFVSLALLLLAGCGGGEEVLNSNSGVPGVTATYSVQITEGSTTLNPGETVSGMEGKTVHTVTVTEVATGNPVPGLNVSLYGEMDMTTMVHSTPAAPAVDNGDGTYTCAVYYLMPSMMGSWSLDVTAGGETSRFNVQVAMAMGDTKKQVAKNAGDTFDMMGTPTVRNYYLFNEGVTATSFRIFTATREMMKSHPAVYPGKTLNMGVFTISSMTVEVSSDGGTTWTTMSEAPAGSGTWEATGLNLSSGSAATLEVRLAINGNAYVDNGNPATGSNPTFSVTVP